MKIFAALIFIVFYQLLAAQQTQKIDAILQQKRIKVEQLTITSAPTISLIPSHFAQENVKSQLASLEDLTIVKVYYVYTSYKKSEHFNQVDLDKKRFELFAKSAPQIFDNPLIEWDVIEQTGCNDFTEGTNFFHGFVLVHRPIMTTESRAEEVRKLMEWMDHPEKEIIEPTLDLISEQIHSSEVYESVSPKFSRKAHFKEGDYALYQYLQKEVFPVGIVQARYDQWVKFHFNVDEFGRISSIQMDSTNIPNYIQDEISETFVLMPVWEPAEINGKNVASEVAMELRVSYARTTNGMYTKDGERPSFMADVEEKLERLKQPQDAQEIAFKASTISRGMAAVEKDQKVAVVMDITGSMYGHIAALMRWIEKNPDSLSITSYSFFNDGDGKPSREKEIGETGGIYFLTDLKEMRSTVEKAMLAGSGGEPSESDLEAVLNSISKDSECDVILLIGDNYSEIRDFSLLKDISKPVNVLICAAPTTIQVDYLTLVQSTGGYLLMNGKKFSFQDLHRGDIISIEGYDYKFTGKEFKFIGETNSAS